MSTKLRILDAAETLFGQRGIDATSLREITAEAGVNLASVNYHFQSKDALIRAVIARRIDPINLKRLAMLDAIEGAAAGQPPPVAPIVKAFLLPVLELHRSAPGFGPMMGRIYSEPGDFMVRLFNDHLRPTAARFIAAFERALPHLASPEVAWRISFMVGAMAHTMAAGGLLKMISSGQCDSTDVEETLRHMAAFITAGFQAPAAEEQLQHAR